MIRCTNCSNGRVNPRHFREHPDHVPIIGDVSDGYKEVLLRQINNARMYSQLRSDSERYRFNARKVARSLENKGIDVGRYVTNYDDYAEPLEVDEPTPDNPQVSLWRLAIPATIAGLVGWLLYTRKEE